MSEDRADLLTAEALERAGLADMRPGYRKLLVRLRQADPDGFEEATRRYREEVEPAIAAGEADPVSAWVGYGLWLADRLARGRAISVDASGRARPLDSHAGPGSGALVLHVPDDDRAPVVALARPREPSESQRTTSDLLIR